MEILNKYLSKISNIDNDAMNTCAEMWNSIAIPLGSLGKVQDLIIKASGIYGTPKIDCFKKAVVVMCADNGIVSEGVTQSPSSVTGVVAENMTSKKATISLMSAHFGGEVFVLDVGMESNHDENNKIINKKTVNGTKNFLLEDAMTKEQCISAIIAGIEMVEKLKTDGFNLIATGEMGIGNTTTASAIASVLLNKPVAEVTGKGAGLTSEALLRKIFVIEQGIKNRKVNKDDVFGLLCGVGGLDIAAMCGVFIGGGIYRIPILVDGFISGISALVAINLCEKLRDFMFSTHISAEPAGKMLVNALNLPFLIDANMRLGEGSGAVMCYPFFDVGLKIFNEMASFEVANFHKYEKLI